MKTVQEKESGRVLGEERRGEMMMMMMIAIEMV